MKGVGGCALVLGQASVIGQQYYSLMMTNQGACRDSNYKLITCQAELELDTNIMELSSAVPMFQVITHLMLLLHNNITTCDLTLLQTN